MLFDTPTSTKMKLFKFEDKYGMKFYKLSNTVMTSKSTQVLFLVCECGLHVCVCFIQLYGDKCTIRCVRVISCSIETYVFN